MYDFQLQENKQSGNNFFQIQLHFTLISIHSLFFFLAAPRNMQNFPNQGLNLHPLK